MDLLSRSTPLILIPILPNPTPPNKQNKQLRAWENNYLVKAVMLQGRREGELFSAGWERSSKPPQHPDVQHAFQRFSQLAYLLTTLSKPTVSWLNGAVRDSGLGLALARCRIATKSSSFRVGNIRRGWALDGGLSFALPRLRAGGKDRSGPGGTAALAMARYLALTGAPLSGADMLACGMATHLMDDAVAALLHKRCVRACVHVLCAFLVILLNSYTSRNKNKRKKTKEKKTKKTVRLST
jgi:enoyl-CoA hydratase/carnithine racemase